MARQVLRLFHRQGSVGPEWQSIDVGVARECADENDKLPVRRKCGLVLQEVALDKQVGIAAALQIEDVKIRISAPLRTKNQPPPVRRHNWIIVQTRKVR